MVKLHLNNKDLQLIKDILVKHVPHHEIWAYGSRLKGDNHEASDLDLVIRNPQDLTKACGQLSQLKQAFSESELPIFVDVMDWAHLPDGFKQEINQCHVRL